MDERERETALNRLNVVDGQLAALDNAAAVLSAIAMSQDSHAARKRLQEPPFGYSEIQAAHVVEMPWGRSTQLGRRALEEERAALRAMLDQS